MQAVAAAGSRPLFIAFATACAAALLSSSCGSSSSQTQGLTGPSGDKCGVQVTADTAAFSAAGGLGSLRVSANRECEWSARSDAAWVTLSTPADGRGDGSVRFSVVANADPSARNAGITVNDQRLQITQAAKPCELVVSSNRESVGGAGGDLTVDVRASAAQCSWTAAANVPWIAIVSGREGRGNGSVRFHVDPVTGPPRSGSLTVAGQTVNVDQGTGCTFAIGADAFAVDASGGERQVPVTAPEGCPWTSESATPWVTIVNGSSGAGTGIVTFRVAATDGPARTGILTVAGRTVTVSQSVGCSYAVRPTNASVGAQAGSTGVQVEAGPGCPWTASSAVPWITLTAASGSGNGQVQAVVAANDGPARSGTITVAGQSVAISQASGCTFAISPSEQNVGGGGGAGGASVTTSAGCSWTASSSVDWITVSTPSGTGAGQASFTVAPNATPPRTGRVTIAGRAFTVTQASQCSWLFAPPSHEIPANGGNGNVLVFVTGACSWSAVSTVPWIQITEGQSAVGPAFLRFVVPANPGPDRTGTILLGGETYRVHQQGS